VEFYERGGELVTARSELRELGLQVPEGPATGMVALDRLPGVKYRIDRSQQILHIAAAVEALALTRIDPQDEKLQNKVPLRRGRGAVLNYDLFANFAKDSVSGVGLLEGRIFLPRVVVTSGLLISADSVEAHARRLDTVVGYADPDSLRRYNAGDVITGGLSWTRPVRLGGLQFSTDFGLRPDLITFPLPSLSGQTAVPSTIDVLVNGVQQLSRGVDPGPFAIQQIPVTTGAGTVTLLVKDATGQQTVQNLPFYASGSLLAPKLKAVSAEIGAVRKNFATNLDHYGELAAQGTLRYGLSPVMTVEGHVEATPNLAMAGAGAVFDIAQFAILSLGAAASRYHTQFGTSVYGSIERATPRYRVAASALFNDDAYRDIAAVNGDAPPRLVLQANAGVTLDRLGSFGTAYTYVQKKTGLAQTEMQGFSTVSATYSRQIFSSAYIYGTAFRRFDERGSTGVMIGLSTRLGERGVAGSSVTSGPDGQSADIALSQPATDIGDIGMRVYAQQAAGTRAMAEVTYRAPWSLLSAAIDVNKDDAAARLRAEGAVSFLRGRLLASNRIQDSFALVDTNGIPDLRVLRENRPVGKTDSRGQLLVTDLRSFETNKLTIDPNDLPVDVDAKTTSLFVRPFDRAGVLARFAIKQQYSALVTLHDAAGAPLPLGSIAVLGTTRAKMPVGYDGQVYVVGLVPKRNRLNVTLPNQKRCTAIIVYEPMRGSVPEIGPLTCLEGAR
jgi:outer membrane usher protein